MKQSFSYRKLLLPIVDLLRQGITPEKIALSLAIGICLGVFPVIGGTTILCTLAAIVFRLNLPAIQLVNYFVYPLQLALLIPFIRFGEVLFRSPHVSLSLTIIFESIKRSAWQTIKTYWTSGWHAMIAWCLVGPLAIWILYLALVSILRRLAVATGPVMKHDQSSVPAHD
ncbi:MAG: DUF2062 domain-containing protein [Acidobacteria bacterium]|nr:MAG: DUF2062 domain-containing protein [Acidobacteriota bacterium]PYY16369.1 MAG: DUF2062 domain-containing protein [Acidobacteriota bacterium]